MNIHENTSSEPKAALIRPMLSHLWIHSPDEDWRGITDPATRKKLQNKLNQRAQRNSLEFAPYSISYLRSDN